MCKKEGENWEKFVDFAIKELGIEFRFPEDYEPFWKCWCAAVDSLSDKKINVDPAVHKDEKVRVHENG